METQTSVSQINARSMDLFRDFYVYASMIFLSNNHTKWNQSPSSIKDEQKAQIQCNFRMNEFRLAIYYYFQSFSFREKRFFAVTTF